MTISDLDAAYNRVRKAQDAIATLDTERAELVSQQAEALRDLAALTEAGRPHVGANADVAA